MPEPPRVVPHLFLLPGQMCWPGSSLFDSRDFWTAGTPNWPTRLPTGLDRGMATLAPVVALGFGFLFAMFWPGIWMRDVYTESIIFLTLIVAGAILSGPIGVMLCAGFVAGDILHDLMRGQYARDPLAVAGSQLISYHQFASTD